MTHWKYKLAKAALDFLCRTYPKCFDLENQRPLKIGIGPDIHSVMPPEISIHVLNQALGIYTSTVAYLRGVIAGRPRIDLNGHDAGEVTPEEAAYSKAKLDVMQPPPGSKLPPLGRA